MVKNKRYENYGMWVSIASAVLLILQTLDVGIDAGKYNTIVNAVLGILVALGILSNPSQGKGYSDK